MNARRWYLCARILLDAAELRGWVDVARAQDLRGRMSVAFHGTHAACEDFPGDCDAHTAPSSAPPRERAN